MSLDALPFNWFDLVLLAVLILGIQRGRKRGISEELLGVLKWLTIIICCAFLYRPIGMTISNSPVFGKLSGYLMAYIGAALVISALFTLLKRALGGKLVGSDVFGRTEFYLGMLAGLVRFACILVAALALLNAKAYSSADLTAEANYQNDVYGSTFFPTFNAVQAQVFDRSLSGPWIKQYLGSLLITPTAPEQKQLKQKDYALP